MINNAATTAWNPSHQSHDAPAIITELPKETRFERSFLVDKADGLHEDIAVDGKAVRADFVHGVLRGVVIAVVGAVVEIDDVDRGYAAGHEGQMIVVYRFFILEEISLIAEFLCGLAHQGHEPIGRTGLALNIQVLVADHVGEQKSLDAAECSVATPFCCKVATAVCRVGGRPLLDSLFAVKEDQPHGVAVDLLASELICNGEQKSGSGGAI